MRHIPEEELHAYLDQALSRAQAVEIESHLASCPVCRGERDAIAGLRDRTTALLATLAPRTTPVRPAWMELRRRHLAASARRANLVRGGVWAASLLMAISLGYRAHSWRDAVEAEQHTPTATAARPAAAPGAALPVQTVAMTPVRRPLHRPAGASAHPVTGIEVDTLDNAPSGPAGGVWRTESLERAVASGLTVPRVAGLPVLQIQVQEASSPLVAVDQQLTSGETLRTIEGPAAEMAALDRSSVASTGADGAGASSVSIKHGNRMLLMTARIPAESLRALLAKVPLRQ
ncbi:MAG: zf-HC2 domain-containing protein [Gemmatimonadetes bacterium]|nr:zf-HC2 domain-containing protein [Gemmatimonadota bacterium]